MGNTETGEHSPIGLDWIGIVPMPISSEARGREDESTGYSNQAARRKLQNRLNQRASSQWPYSIVEWDFRSDVTRDT